MASYFSSENFENLSVDLCLLKYIKTLGILGYNQQNVLVLYLINGFNSIQ